MLIYLIFFHQSLDFDICENHLLLSEQRAKGYKFVVKKNLARWFIFLLIGILTALIGALIDIVVEELSVIKYKGLKKRILLLKQTKLHEAHDFCKIKSLTDKENRCRQLRFKSVPIHSISFMGCIKHYSYSSRVSSCGLCGTCCGWEWYPTGEMLFEWG